MRKHLGEELYGSAKLLLNDREVFAHFYLYEVVRDIFKYD